MSTSPFVLDDAPEDVIDLTESRITQTTHSVNEIVQLCTSKEWAVPSLQRDVVWSPDHAVYLLSTLAGNMSAGQLLLWEPLEDVTSLRRGDGGSLSRACQFILDGQQRTTTLVALCGLTVPEWVVSKKAQKAFALVRETVCIDLLTGSLAVKTLGQQKADPRWQPFQQVFQVAKRTDWARQYRTALAQLGLDPAEAEAQATNLYAIATRVGKRRISVDTGRWDRYQAAEQFVRTNKAGKPLSDEEVLLGHLSVHDTELRGKLDELIVGLQGRGLERAQLTASVLRTLLAIHALENGKAPCARISQYELHDVVTPAPSTSVSKTAAAWNGMVSYLEARGITPAMIGGYNVLVALVIAAHRWPELRADGDDRLLALFLLGERVAIHRTHSTDGHKLDQKVLSEAASASDFVMAYAVHLDDFHLERHNRHIPPTTAEQVLATPKSQLRVNSTPATEYAVMARRRGWVDPHSGQAIDYPGPAKGYHWHHVYPEALAKHLSRATKTPNWVDSLANIIRTEATTNIDFSSLSPGDALANVIDGSLETQLFADAVEMTSLASAERVIRARAEALAHELDWPLRLLELA